MGLKNQQKYQMSAHFKLRLKQRFGLNGNKAMNRWLGSFFPNCELIGPEKDDMERWTDGKADVILSPTNYTLITVYPHNKTHFVPIQLHSLNPIVQQALVEAMKTTKDREFIESARRMQNRVAKLYKAVNALANSRNFIHVEERQEEIKEYIESIYNEYLSMDEIQSEIDNNFLRDNDEVEELDA